MAQTDFPIVRSRGENETDMTVFPMTPELLAAEIDLPIADWPGNCHAVATAVLERAPVAGMRLVRGHFHGFVSRRSVYSAGPCQHSWLELEDGRILDPTRWAMETPDNPEIYCGENDAYDEAGLELAATAPPIFPGMAVGFEPALAKAGAEKVAQIAQAMAAAAPTDLDPEGRELRRFADRIHTALKSPPEQMRDPDALFSALQAAGLKALIKIDIWQKVMEPEKGRVRRGANRIFEAPPRTELEEAAKLCRIFCHFLRIEERDNIEAELEELGYELEDLWNALNRLEGFVNFQPGATIEDIPSRYLDDLNVIAGDLLGQGYGQDIRVERYAASLGLDREALDDLIRRAGARSGYCSAWI